MLLELYPKLEFGVDLDHVHNVDLFARGYYQIRTALKCSPKFCQSKIDVHLLRSSGWLASSFANVFQQNIFTVTIWQMATMLNTSQLVKKVEAHTLSNMLNDYEPK